LKNGEPKLTCEDTRDKNVLDILLILITKRAAIWVGETSFLSICSPTSILDCQPNKSFAFASGPRLPEAFPWFKSDGTNKKIPVG
jgi:hypothetical protein